MPLILPNTIANETPADGDKLQQNFATVQDWANQDAVTADGSTAMLAPLLLPGAPTQPNQASTKQYGDDMLTAAKAYSDTSKVLSNIRGIVNAPLRIEATSVAVMTNAGGDADIAFANAFSNIPIVMVDSGDPNTGLWFLNIHSALTTTTGFSVRVWSASTNGSVPNLTVRVDYLAIGPR